MPKTPLWLGDYPVRAVDALKITMEIGEQGGKKVYIHVHPTGGFPHTVKVGDKLPLYTEVSYGKPSEPPKQ